MRYVIKHVFMGAMCEEEVGGFLKELQVEEGNKL